MITVEEAKDKINQLIDLKETAEVDQTDKLLKRWLTEIKYK